MGAGFAFDPHQAYRDSEERERLRARGQLLAGNLVERAVEIRSAVATLAMELDNIRLDLERLSELAERLGELGG
jgi:hypothetical protein